MHTYILGTLSLPLNRDETDRCASLVAIISKEAREEIQTFNPETTVEKRSKKKPDWLEREKDTFSMSESKVTNFYLRLEKKYVFIISFIFDYIPFVIEISAPLRESPFCQEPSVALSRCRKYLVDQFCRQFCGKFLRYSAAETCAFQFKPFFYRTARSTLIKVNYAIICITFDNKNCNIMSPSLCFR